MALSASMRNRIVGFGIVITLLVILLPLILSKDMIKRHEINAIAINQQGAVLDKNGQLQYQAEPNLEQSLNINNVNNQLNPPPVANTNVPQNGGDSDINFSGMNKPASNNDLNGEILQAQRPAPNPSVPQFNRPAAPQAPKEEVLVAKKPAPQQPPKEEVLVAKKPAPQQPPKEEVLVAKKPTPAPSNSSNSSASSAAGHQVIAGSVYSGKYVVQVGVFSKKDNASNIVNKIKGMNLPVYAVEVNTNGRLLYRVFAGSSDNRNDLNKVVSDIEKVCNIKGKVVPH